MAQGNEISGYLGTYGIAKAGPLRDEARAFFKFGCVAVVVVGLLRERLHHRTLFDT